MHAVKARTSDWTTSGAEVAIVDGSDATALAVACRDVDSVSVVPSANVAPRPDVADHAHWCKRRPLRIARHGLVTRCRGMLESQA